jgi:tetratricopeptide (TPR) repeat protein
VAASLFYLDLLEPTSEAARQVHRQSVAPNLPALPRSNPVPIVPAVPNKTMEEIMQDAVVFQEKLVRDNPTVGGYIGLGVSYSALGKIVCEQSKPQDALDWYAKALRTLQTARQAEPGHTQAREALRDNYRGRADAFARLQRHAESLADWDRALELDTWPDRNELRLQHAQALARVGEHAQATAEARGLAEGKDLPGGVLYALARVYALSAKAVHAGQFKGAVLPQAERDKLAEQYAAHAIDLLRKAQGAGFFKLQANVAQLKGDRDLDWLREREAFKKLGIDTGAKGQPGS